MKTVKIGSRVQGPARTQRVLRAGGLLALGMAMCTTAAMAQVLSSPMGAGAVAGSGAAVHGAQSAFPPLVPREGVVPWSTLSKVSEVFKKPRIIITFSDAVRRLDGTTVKVEGYMTPLDPSAKQVRFLLLSVPPTCPFCAPGGAESMIEVHAPKAIKYTQNAVLLEGKLQVLDDDPQGFYYRMTHVKLVK